MTDTLNDITSALNAYVVAPLNAFGLGGFVFDAQTEERAILSADITDHFTEDNKALQDHIAIRPRRITLRGYVGELVYDTAGNFHSSLQTVTQKLTQISAFLPQISAAAVQAQAAISGINSAGVTQQSFVAAIPAAANIYSLVKNAIGTVNGNTKNQQSAYQYLAACQLGGVLMGVQTPWEFMTNMAIETIEAIQPDESIFVTDFSVTYKQIRIAVTQTATAILSGTGTNTPPTQTFSQAVAALQGASTVNNGVTQGAPSIVSLSNSANNPLARVFSLVTH